MHRRWTAGGSGWAVVAIVLASAAGCQMPVSVARVKGYDAYRQGDMATAVQHFQNCVERDPTDKKSYYYLGLINLKHLNNPAEAQRNLELAHELRSTRSGPTAAFKTEPHDTAVPMPTVNDIADALAEALYRQNNPPQLFGFLQQQVDEFGTLEDYLRQARYMQLSGDPDAARLAHLKAIRIAPRDVRAYLAMAEFYDQIGDREQALIQLRKAYGLRPDDLRIAEKIRAHGMVPGPTIALPPDE